MKLISNAMCAIRIVPKPVAQPRSRNRVSSEAPITTSGAVSGSTRKVSTALLPRKRWRTRAIASSVPSTTRDGRRDRGDLEAHLQRLRQRRVLERVGPVVQREALPGVVELARGLVEREQDDHEDRHEDVQHHQAGDDPQYDVAEFAAPENVGFLAGSRCRSASPTAMRFLDRHTRSSVPSARV